MVVGELESLLEIEMLPAREPTAVGAYFSARVADWPAGIVAGVAIPDATTAFALIVIALTVRSPEPWFVSSRFCEAFEPTVTFPKSMLDVLTASFGWAASTVPESATEGEFVPSELATTSVPEVLPAEVPFSQTRKLALWPAGSVNGRLRLETANALFERLAEESVMLAVPVLVIVALFDVFEPMATLPKLRLSGAI